MLDRLQIRFAVGGSYASGARGVPRQTNDIDVLVELSQPQRNRFIEAIEVEFEVTSKDVEMALTGQDPMRSFQLFHREELFKVDVFLGRFPELAESEIERASRIELLPGIWAPCLTQEDIVIEKLLWYELGNRVSDRQWNDLVGVIEVQGPDFDRAYVRDWGARLGVSDLVEEAFAEAKEF
ncbi:MAG: hypothetical protein HZC36_06775 [Armatimonadetes bacterium]|nr:hypothetical protein [Armatimonadota bacterium]